MSPVICDYDKNRKDSSKSAGSISTHLVGAPRYHLSVVITDQVTPTELPPTVGVSCLPFIVVWNQVVAQFFVNRSEEWRNNVTWS